MNNPKPKLNVAGSQPLKPSKLEEILKKYERGVYYAATGKWTNDKPKFNIPEAHAQILALVEEVGIKFLESCGEDDKIEAWKKYLKSGGQL